MARKIDDHQIFVDRLTEKIIERLFHVLQRRILIEENFHALGFETAAGRTL